MNTSRKILIIYPVDFGVGQNQGIYEKMMGQGRAFEQNGYSVEYVFFSKNKCLLKQNGKEKIYGKSLFRGWAKYKYLFAHLEKQVCLREYDIVFIRHLLFTSPLFKFLEKVSVTATKILYEFPTWPYDEEWRHSWKEILLKIDQRNKARCIKKIDLVIHYGGFGDVQKSIQISNGIYVPSPLITPFKKNSTKTNLVAIGKWAYWHGLDRAINGIDETSADIHLDIIGNGPEVKNLKALVNKKSLQSKVTFHGSLYGKNTERFLINADLGIGTLGLHRKGVLLDSSLKHRMYCSYGLPFILSTEDGDFAKNLPFCFYIDQSDEPLDFDRILLRFKEFQKGNETNKYRRQIHKYALEHLTWDNKVAKILAALV